MNLTASEKIICIFATSELYEKIRGYVPQIKKEWFAPHLQGHWQKILDCYMNNSTPVVWDIWKDSDKMLAYCVEEFGQAFHYTSKIESNGIKKGEYIVALQEEFAERAQKGMKNYAAKGETELAKLANMYQATGELLLVANETQDGADKDAQELIDAVNGAVGAFGVITPFECVNKVFPMGVNYGSYLILGGWGGTGKTRHAITWSLYHIERNGRVFFSSAENPTKVIHGWFAEVLCGVSKNQAYRNGGNDLVKYTDAIQTILEWRKSGKLRIDSTKNLAQMRIALMSFCGQGGKDVFLAMDYFELYIPSWRHHQNGYDNAGFEIHDIIVTCMVAALVLCQLSSEHQKDGKMPKDKDLRFGVTLRQNCTAVFMLYREEGQTQAITALHFYQVGKMREGEEREKAQEVIYIGAGGKHFEQMPLTTHNEAPVIRDYFKDFEGRQIVIGDTPTEEDF